MEASQQRRRRRKRQHPNPICPPCPDPIAECTEKLGSGESAEWIETWEESKPELFADHDHSVNSHIFKAYEEKLPYFDQSVSALIEDLYAGGLSERVLFIFCGEFGRTPLVRNQDASGRPGRDHWSRAMSVFLSGGGLQMGQVIGATSARGEEPVERIMDSNCLLATIYHRFGIDMREAFYNTAGRPIPILTDGEPIVELL